MKIIINADDFGYSHGINYGIIDSYKEGVLTSTTLMMNMPGTNHAVQLMEIYPDLPVGLHLNFTLGQPLTDGKSLVNEKGFLIKPSNLPDGHEYSPEDVYREIEAQYNAFIDATKKKPTHLDSHLFATDKISIIREQVILFAGDKNIPVRNCQVNGFETVDFITHRSFDEKPTLEYVLTHLDKICELDCAEIMTHPGYVDKYVLKNSSYNIQRVDEVEFLTDVSLSILFKEKGIKLISYADISSKS